jgi:pre-mRNA-splicing factor ISY1
MPRARYELVQNVDALYYGYRDEEDGTLLEYEASITPYEPALPQDPAIPSQAQVGAWLLERKKAELLARYT